MSSIGGSTVVHAVIITKHHHTPSLDYDAIFQHLEEVRGSVDIRDSFVSDIIKEAGKFRRKKLVQELETWRATLRNHRPPLVPPGPNPARNKTLPPVTRR